MKLFSLAIRDLLRRPKRNILFLLSIVISISLLISLSMVSSSANRTILEVISKTGHTLTVRPAISDESMQSTISLSEVVLGKYIPEKAIPEIQKLYDKAIRAGWEKRGGLVSRPGIGDINIEPPTWAPRLYEKMKIKNTEIIVAGVEFLKEYFVRFWWKLASGTWPEDSTLIRKAQGDEAIIGGSFAIATGYKVGDKIKINGTEFKILGVLEETNSPDDYIIFIPLKTAQGLFKKKGLISILSVRAMCPKCPVGDAAIELNKKIRGITAVSQLDVAETQFQFFNMLYKFLLAIVIATIAVSILSIFNTVTGSLYTRAREIGLLKATGATRFQILRIFIYEYLVIGLLAGISGYLLGIVIALILNHLLGISAIIRLEVSYIWISIIIGILCSLVAILYPAYKLSRMKITETFKTQWET